MRTKRILALGVLVVLAVFLTACASSVKKVGQTHDYKYTGQKFNNVRVSLNSEAQEKLKDNSLFSADQLLEAVKNQMDTKRLLSDASQDVIEIVVTSIRTRSTASAVFFGFMAGSDQLDGDVFIKNSEGKVLNSFNVSASYALGGLAGGQASARMNWLYKEFAELTVQTILGEKKD